MALFSNLPRSSANNAIVWLDAADVIESASGRLLGRDRQLVLMAADLLTPFVAPSVAAVVRSAAPGLSGTSELASEYRYAIAAVRSSAPNQGPLNALAEHRKTLKALADGRPVSRSKRAGVVKFLDTLASEYQAAETSALDRGSDPFRESR